MPVEISAVYIEVAVLVFMLTVAIFFAILWRPQGPL
jgi:hypothetical protein